MEAPELWRGVHTRLIDTIADVLNAIASARYFADVEERVFLCEPDDPYLQAIVPDVVVSPVVSEAPRSESSRSAIVALSRSVKVRLLEEEVTEHYIAIRSLAFGGPADVVTVIELLSPANKLRNSAGRTSYLARRRSVMNSPTHFIEIDLRRAGERTPMSEVVAGADYLVTVSRAGSRPIVEVFPAALTDPLPSFPVPLLPGDDDLVLNLQDILHTVHDRSGYARRLNYSAPIPDPALSADRRAWLSQFVLSAGASIGNP